MDTGYASGYILVYVLFLPFFSLKGEWCFDGGLTTNQPILGKVTVCINPYMWTDLNTWGCLWPVICMKRNAELVIRGFNDAKAPPEHWAPLEPFRHKKPNKESFIGCLERTVLTPEARNVLAVKAKL